MVLSLLGIKLSLTKTVQGQFKCCDIIPDYKARMNEGDIFPGGDGQIEYKDMSY